MARKRSLPSQPRSLIEINYLYFGLFFAILVLTSGSSVFLKENLSGSRIFFFLYATGQAAIEILVFAFLCWLIPRKYGKIAALSFIGLTFVCLIVHIFDFLMDRVLDLSVWEVFNCFVINETFDNFLYLLDASGIALWLWAFLFAIVASLPLVGIALHKWTSRWSSNHPLKLRSELLLQSFVCITIALLCWEFTASKVIHPNSYTAFLKSLPWKWTFLQPDTVLFPLPAALANHPEENDLWETIHSDNTVLEKRPNIYLFIIESFREDCITSEIAPNLSHFKQSANHFDISLSNGNGSHLSWFSIFHSQFAHFWHQLQTKKWKMGSPPLQLLKKWGYQVRLYSSAELNYYDMEKLLFGHDREILDSAQTFPHAPPIHAAETDAQALAALQKDLRENPSLQEGQCIIVFWDATHFDYSWPKDFPPKFKPFSKELDYFHLIQSRNKIEKIKNRYRNAVFYVDSLFGKFQEGLSDPDAIVVVTGDHGEEFFERGHLFHNSHLTKEQTNIPLYIQLGKNRMEHPPKLVSQMDIFPTIFHHLSGKQLSFLQGQSILEPNRWPFAMIARFNAGRTPYEFCLHNGKNKLIAQFYDKSDIFSSQALKIRSLWSHNDTCLFECNHSIQEWIQAEFGSAIERLFSQDNSHH